MNRQKILAEMGIETWVPRSTRDATQAAVETLLDEAQQALQETEPEAVVSTASEEGEIAADSLGRVAQEVADCRRCGLCETRTQAVPGVGNPAATWMFVGEAPGAEEDRRGEPFVGRAGQLLTNMLAAMGMKREDVFIANVLKCRPPNNRNPQADEVDQCKAYLHRQIGLIQPKIIVALGAFAARELLDSDLAIGKLRGRVHEIEPGGTPCIATYHPAYLLRDPLQKAKVWQDMLLARDALAKAG